MTWNLYREANDELVQLPAELETFRSGSSYRVLNVSHAATPGSSGKVEVEDAGTSSGRRYFYPGVFRCYIAEAPRVAEHG